MRSIDEPMRSILTVRPAPPFPWLSYAVIAVLACALGVFVTLLCVHLIHLRENREEEP